MDSTTTEEPLLSDTISANVPSTKPKPNVARTISYVLGGFGIAMLIAAIFMLIFLRNKNTVITTIVPSAALVSPSFQPLPELKLQNINLAQSFQVSDITGLTSPVATVTDQPPVTPPGTTATPAFDPGMAPFDTTNINPLQSPPQGFGWVAMTPTADQWFSSMPNGYANVAQYTYTQSTFMPDSDAYTSDTNSIAFCRNDPLDAQNDSITGVNTTASSVGSSGYGSIKISDDGTRMYVAYRQPLMGATADAQIFPFLQLSGQVATFVQSTTTNWAYSCELELSNPFGSQTTQFEQIIDPNTGLLLTGDDFGSILKTSRNLLNGNLIVAARCNFGIRISDGAFISIVEENSNGSYTQSGLIFGVKGLTLNEKFAFGNDFAIGNDACVCAIRGVKLLYYQRDDTNLNWKFMQEIKPPGTASNQDFGTSIEIRGDGMQMVVGSPTSPSGTNTGIGGNVYVYTRTKNTWAVSQVFADPFTSDHTKGAFGRFLSVDKRFLVCAISANANNSLSFTRGPTVGKLKDPDKPYIVFVSIQQSSGTLDANSAQQKPQQDTLETAWLDPLYGANVALEFVDEQNSELRAIATSPMNQTGWLFTLAVSA